MFADTRLAEKELTASATSEENSQRLVANN
jgi:hypothetical protein